MFKLPLSYRQKQGNQQLMLWLTHAYIVFDRVEEQVSKQQQVQITEWLTNWSDDLPAQPSDRDTNAIGTVTM
jgi:hypothetical protein